ncbi:hypothetical protein D3C73_986730 [compost metagenome]
MSGIPIGGKLSNDGAGYMCTVRSSAIAYAIWIFCGGQRHFFIRIIVLIEGVIAAFVRCCDVRMLIVYTGIDNTDFQPGTVKSLSFGPIRMDLLKWSVVVSVSGLGYCLIREGVPGAVRINGSNAGNLSQLRNLVRRNSDFETVQYSVILVVDGQVNAFGFCLVKHIGLLALHFGFSSCFGQSRDSLLGGIFAHSCRLAA